VFGVMLRLPYYGKKYFCGIQWMGDSVTTELLLMDMLAEATKYTVIYRRVRKIEKSYY
jgi:hypothetical protein